MIKLFSWMLPGVVLAGLIGAGCQPKLSQESFGQEEEAWEMVIRESYPDYRPPRTKARGEHDRATIVVKPSAMAETEASAASSDPDAWEPVAIESVDAVEVIDEQPEDAADAAEVAEAVEVAEVAEAAEPAEGSAAEPAVAVETIEYVVQPGDTLSGIAKKHYHDGAKWKLIMDANPKLSNPNQLRAGYKLNIPKL